MINNIRSVQANQPSHLKRPGFASRQRQTGAVSIFMVIFAMLLMSVLTISFLRIMTKDQSQASDNDLSQSAYDSAQAGVEDAKRAMLAYLQQCKTNAANCASWASVMSSQDCNAAIQLTGVVKNADFSTTPTGSIGEVKVQQSTQVDENNNSIDKALDQAYTCVTLQMDTDDYEAPLAANESKLIPLTATTPFSSITIQWYSRSDVSNTTGTIQGLEATAGTQSQRLDQQSEWGANKPSVIRAQYAQVGSQFNLSDFDASKSDQSNANTVFLYPTSDGNQTTSLTSRDIRQTDTSPTQPATKASAPLPVKCNAVVASASDYSCSLTLTLPEPIGGGTANTAYLRLTALYNATHIRVSLGGSQFKAVQPIVDSTGRSGDLFRRIKSRVDLYDTGFPLPDAALDVSGNLCKNFAVTDTQYISGSCTP